MVLIESDWNLKHILLHCCHPRPQCINRIRLEFKAHNRDAWHTRQQGINRIRLEFKVNDVNDAAQNMFVLIESDWNLKETRGQQSRHCPSINRIRLEFKDLRYLPAHFSGPVLIESDWNLK